MTKRIMSRGTGKTVTLILLSSVTRQPILCDTKKNAEHIKSIADSFHIPLPDPISASDLVGMESIGKVYVDDADLVLDSLLHTFGGEIDCMTISPENDTVATVKP